MQKQVLRVPKSGSYPVHVNPEAKLYWDIMVKNKTCAKFLKEQKDLKIKWLVSIAMFKKFCEFQKVDPFVKIKNEEEVFKHLDENYALGNKLLVDIIEEGALSRYLTEPSLTLSMNNAADSLSINIISSYKIKGNAEIKEVLHVMKKRGFAGKLPAVQFRFNNDLLLFFERQSATDVSFKVSIRIGKDRLDCKQVKNQVSAWFKTINANS